MSYNIQWNDVIKKEARGINDEDLEVQRVEGNYVLVQKGIINKEKFITITITIKIYLFRFLIYRVETFYLDNGIGLTNFCTSFE